MKLPMFAAYLLLSGYGVWRPYEAWVPVSIAAFAWGMGETMMLSGSTTGGIAIGCCNMLMAYCVFLVQEKRKEIEWLKLHEKG